MTSICPHHKPTTVPYFDEHPKAAKGLEQRQCPDCQRWFFRGEFRKGWGKGLCFVKSGRIFAQSNIKAMELRYFPESEFTMDGVNVFTKMDETFLALLDQCRHIAGVGFVITSSYRSPEKNKAVGGASNSMHLYGRAVDVVATDGKVRAKIVKAALSLGLSVGVMKNAIHLDNREGQVLFHYYGK